MEKFSPHLASTVELLDPMITQLMNGCTKETALRIKESIPTIPSHVLQKLHPYIIVPIMGQVSNDTQKSKNNSLGKCEFGADSNTYFKCLCHQRNFETVDDCDI